MRAGRFGPYVNWGKINATLKSGMPAETVTLEEAVRLIADKEAASSKPVKRAAPGSPKRAAKKAAAPEKEPSGQGVAKARKVKRA